MAIQSYLKLTRNHSPEVAREMLKEMHGLTQQQLDDIAPPLPKETVTKQPSLQDLKLELKGMISYLRLMAQKIMDDPMTHKNRADHSKTCRLRAAHAERLIL